MFLELQELRENQVRLEECLENVKACHQLKYTVIADALQEERYRCERLEEELNDLTELHQNEISNLNEELASMEEKIAYQAYEGATDITEALGTCETRLSKMELQQQVAQLEGLENATAQTPLEKLINVLLAITAVVLMFVSTVATCVVHLMKKCPLIPLLLVVLFSLRRHLDAISEYLIHSLCTLHPEKGNDQ